MVRAFTCPHAHVRLAATAGREREGAPKADKDEEMLQVARIAMFPRKVSKEWVDPVRGPAFLFATMCLLILAAMVSSDPEGSKDSWRRFAKALFWVAAPLQLVMSQFCVANWLLYLRDWEHLSPTWLAVPVANVFGAVAYGAVYHEFGLGALLFPSLQHSLQSSRLSQSYTVCMTCSIILRTCYVKLARTRCAQSALSGARVLELLCPRAAWPSQSSTRQPVCSGSALRCSSSSRSTQSSCTRSLSATTKTAAGPSTGLSLPRRASSQLRGTRSSRTSVRSSSCSTLDLSHWCPSSATASSPYGARFTCCSRCACYAHAQLCLLELLHLA